MRLRIKCVKINRMNFILFLFRKNYVLILFLTAIVIAFCAESEKREGRERTKSEKRL